MAATIIFKEARQNKFFQKKPAQFNPGVIDTSSANNFAKSSWLKNNRAQTRKADPTYLD